MKSTVALFTLGCKLNFAESSTIGYQFSEKGYTIIDHKEKADIYLINTCTVTGNADKECRQHVRRFLKQNPSAFIIVTGCYAQLKPGEIASIKGVDAVLGSNEKFKLFSLLDDFQKKDIACVYASDISDSDDFGFAHSTDADARTRAFLKIQDGCDYKCSFCTIPLARGKSRSMFEDEAVKEFKELIDKGYKEIILTGVNVGDYGKNTGHNLFYLLNKFIEVEGDFRIRISSIEPNLLTNEIINLSAESEKMCNHFHIPLQSGSDKILSLMQRRYKTQLYRDVVNRVKDVIPDAGIGVDVITGFPGETDEEFLNTYEFIKDLPVSYLHAFTYSERPNTKAVTMEAIVPKEERKRRTNMLRILSQKKKHDFYKSLLGTQSEVLFESENHNGLIKGFTSNYVRVNLPFTESLINQKKIITLENINGNEVTVSL